MTSRQPTVERGPSKLLIGAAAVALIVLAVTYLLTRDANKHWDFESIYDQPPEGAIHVLWVGNSHMWWHDMPVMLQKMVPEGAAPMWFEIYAEPGVQTVWWGRSSDAGKAATSQKWDVVMLQPQSVEAAAQPDVLNQGVNVWKGIADETGSKLQVWATWGRDPNNDGYGIYQRPWSGGSLGALTEKLEANTVAAAGKQNVCPIGAAWARAHEQYPKAPLWSPQMGNHGSVVGTYLANAMVFACVWRRDPREITYVPEGLNEANAKNLRAVAWETAVSKGILEEELPAAEAADEAPAEDEPPANADAGTDAN